MKPVTFVVETKLVSHTLFESNDPGAVTVEVAIDDDGDGTFTVDDPDDEMYIRKPLEDLDMLIDMLIQARTVRENLRPAT